MPFEQIKKWESYYTYCTCGKNQVPVTSVTSMRKVNSFTLSDAIEQILSKHYNWSEFKISNLKIRNGENIEKHKEH